MYGITNVISLSTGMQKFTVYRSALLSSIDAKNEKKTEMQQQQQQNVIFKCKFYSPVFVGIYIYTPYSTFKMNIARTKTTTTTTTKNLTHLKLSAIQNVLRCSVYDAPRIIFYSSLLQLINVRIYC